VDTQVTVRETALATRGTTPRWDRYQLKRRLYVLPQPQFWRESTTLLSSHLSKRWIRI
jgi:hypothetical protein